MGVGDGLDESMHMYVLHMVGTDKRTGKKGIPTEQFSSYAPWL